MTAVLEVGSRSTSRLDDVDLRGDVTADNPVTGQDFQQLTDPFRRELLAHCYRMLGSVHDAEDLVQETYLRAWRAYDRFEGRASLRTWLYKIATRVCLTAIEQRGRRPMPSGLGAPTDNPEQTLRTQPEITWLEPVPDRLIGTEPEDPAGTAMSRAGMRLALIAALQHLPASQRAVLVLRDVLAWRAAEVAEVMETSVPAVNSLLQRARAQLEKAALTEDQISEPDDPELRQVLDRYMAAFETADADAIVALFTKDAVWEMPPFPEWFVGAERIAKLVEYQCPGGPGRNAMVPTQANGQPAFALYVADDEGVFRRFQIQVLTVGADGRVTHVGAFFEESLFDTFGLPETVPGPITPGGIALAGT